MMMMMMTITHRDSTEEYLERFQRGRAVGAAVVASAMDAVAASDGIENTASGARKRSSFFPGRAAENPHESTAATVPAAAAAAAAAAAVPFDP